MRVRARADAPEAPASRQRGAALDRLRQTSTERASVGGVPAALAALREAASAGEDPLAVGVVAWEARFARHPALTAERRRHLQTAAALLDRMHGRGAGAALLVDLVADSPAGFEPVSLGYMVCELRRRSKLERRVAKGKPAVPAKNAWWEEREARLGEDANRTADERFKRRRRRGRSC